MFYSNVIILAPTPSDGKFLSQYLRKESVVIHNTTLSGMNTHLVIHYARRSLDDEPIIYHVVVQVSLSLNFYEFHLKFQMKLAVTFIFTRAVPYHYYKPIYLDKWNT